MDLSVIIPAYREGPKLRGLLREIYRKVSCREVIVVVDDSEDPSIKYSPGARILINKSGGFAKAIETGLIHAEGKYSVIVMADGSDLLSDIQEGVKLLENEDCDIYCPTRYDGGRMVNAPFVKTICSRTVNWLAHLKGIPTTDSTNAFKVYRTKAVVELLPLDSKKFEVTLEICLKGYRKGLLFIENPTVWTERSEGQSKFNLLKLMGGYIRLLLN